MKRSTLLGSVLAGGGGDWNPAASAAPAVAHDFNGHTVYSLSTDQLASLEVELPDDRAT